MNGIRQNAIPLFRFNGIQLSLHWSWFLVAAYEISERQRTYSSVTWNVLEYLALFLIVMFHEFGHALACRQVGGEANQIVLWPMGGVAYVSPPQRPKKSPRSPLQVQDSNAPIMPAQVDAALVPAPVIP